MDIFVGTPYEMGYAHGELRTEQVQKLMNGIWEYFEEMVVSLFSTVLYGGAVAYAGVGLIHVGMCLPLYSQTFPAQLRSIDNV